MSRRVLPLLGLLVVVAACGGRLSLSEYAERVEALVVELNTTIEALDVEHDGRGPDVAGEIAYWESRAATRREFFEGLDALGPPEELAELHALAADIMGRYADAEDAVVAAASQLEDVAGIRDLWAGPEISAWRAVDEESRVICLVAQQELDEATQRRAELEGTPWIPAEMTNTVSVAFGCPPVED